MKPAQQTVELIIGREATGLAMVGSSRTVHRRTSRMRRPCVIRSTWVGILAAFLQGLCYLCAETAEDQHSGALSVGHCVGNTTADDITQGFDLTGKVVVITGGDSGIGYALAEALAWCNATVIIANRNATKGQKAAKELAKVTGSSVRAIPLDLASFASVHGFARRFYSEFGPELHVLANNAGAALGVSGNTQDGFEAFFQINYLGPFLLTELLLPALRASATSRVINTAGSFADIACAMAGLPDNCLKDWSFLPPPVPPHRNITVHGVIRPANNGGIANLLKVQHAAELSRRELGNGIEAFAVDPGLVRTPMTRYINFTSACKGCSAPCPFTPGQGASVIAVCMLQNLDPGGYYKRDRGCRKGVLVENGFKKFMVPELYSRSLTWAGISDMAQRTEYVIEFA